MRVLPWLPTILGVLTLLGIAVLAIVRLLPGHSTQTLPPPEPAFTLPGTTSGPQVPISLVPTDPHPTGSRETNPPGADGPAGADTPIGATNPATPGPRPTRTAPAVISLPRTTAPARPVTVTGRYHVLNSYSDNFIGEVLLTNRTGAAQNWVVTLTYPGTLRTSWLESLPQPTLVRRGTTYTWTSSVPLAAGATAQMRFQFDRSGGSDTPGACAVNGSPCT